jgi:hypothetical protein
MSTKNTLANKATRREQRAEHAAVQEKKRNLQARMIELFLEPPEEVQEETESDQ